MKKTIGMLLILSATYNCSIKKHVTEISGTWYSCAKNGDYVEIHIKENKYKYSSYFGVVTNWDKIEIKGDTLIQYDNFALKDSTLIHKGKFHFLNKRELIIEYLASDEKWLFLKYDGEIKNIEDNILLENETKERSKERKCTDQRTEEEKKRDSLDRQIDFKF